MLGDDDERGRQDDEDGTGLEDGMVERRQREPRRIFDEAPVDDAERRGDDVARDDADEDRDDGKKAFERDGSDDRDGKRQERHRDRRHVGRLGGQSCHARCCRHELEADDGDDGAHGCGREDDVDPVRADGADDEADSAEHAADDDEAAERGLVAVLREHEEDRGEEREARAEVGRNLSFAEHEVEERADAVEEQDGRGIHMEENRHEHGRAEHREEMLEGKRDGFEERQPFLDADGASLGHETRLLLNIV